MNDATKIWFPFYVGDYIADTMHLTTEEHGAYLLILCHQWRRGHLDEQELGRVTRLSVDAWSIAQERLKHLLSIDDAGRWYSARLDREKGVWAEKSQKSQEKAKKAANARWKYARERKAKENQEGNTSNAPSIASAEPEEMHDECPSPSPVSTNTPPSTSFRGERASAAPLDAKGEEIENKGETRENGATAASDGSKATQPHPSASQRRVGAKPATLQQVLKAAGTGRKPPISDRRFGDFKRHLLNYYAAANGMLVAGMSAMEIERALGAVPWGVSEDRALVARLSAEPGLSSRDLSVRLGHRLDAIRMCLEHPPARGSVNARDSMVVVLGPSFPAYMDGPVNAFGDKLQPIKLR